VHFIDTVCQPTKQRQNAAIELAKSAMWSSSSAACTGNNTHELVQNLLPFLRTRTSRAKLRMTCRLIGLPTQRSSDYGWQLSTPDSIINAVEQRLSQITPVPTGANKWLTTFMGALLPN